MNGSQIFIFLPNIFLPPSSCQTSDAIYRFYHQSFKVFYLQATTERIVQQLRELLPDCELNPWFLEIISSGTRKDFDLSMNENWLSETRPMLEAFFHAKYFLEMVCRYSEQLDSPPSVLPSGWASVLYLFGLR